MRVIFLDIDGVLNNSGDWHGRKQDYHDKQWGSRPPEERHALDSLDPLAVARLNHIVQQTQAVVVLSSTWRLDTPLSKMSRYLRRRGFESYLYGATPYIATTTRHVRGDEIAWWLERTPTADYVILDDDDDMGDRCYRLVLTKNSIGLTDEDAERAIRLLRYGP